MLVLLLLQPRLHAHMPTPPARCFLFICATFTDFVRFYIFVYTFYVCIRVGVCLCVWACVGVLQLAFSLQLSHLAQS